jgi:electron transfer flavoprotein alpha subunit
MQQLAKLNKRYKYKLRLMEVNNSLSSTQQRTASSFSINANCIGCGACVPDCPVSAIVARGDKYSITDNCIDCGACVGSCPVEAIVEARD